MDRFVDPEYLASYYTRVSREAVKATGFSIDWRREFRTVDPAFKKFIEWQYLRLRELGYVVQGTHPVVWCKHDESPTGDHDRMEGEGVSPEEFNLIKFKLGEKWLVAGTLRPETIFGATNVWLRPDGAYCEAEVDGETWIISSSAANRLAEQQHKVKVVKEFKGSDLIGATVVAPMTGASLPVLPATFVDTELVTGVVYSVPAHAPYDYMGLVDLQEGRTRRAAGDQGGGAEAQPDLDHLDSGLLRRPGQGRGGEAEDHGLERPEARGGDGRALQGGVPQGRHEGELRRLRRAEGERGQAQGRRGDEGPTGRWR